MPSLRPATPDDLPAICRLVDEVNLHHYHGAPEVFLPALDPERMASFWGDFLTRGDAAIYVAEVDGALVGFVVVTQGEERTAFTQAITFTKIISLGVTETLRGQGIGTQLLVRAEAWSRERGVDEIRLNVWAFNQFAVEMYQKHEYAIRSHQLAKRI
jgi:ribosomal protein S18 acetylase RimI-like enzyme